MTNSQTIKTKKSTNGGSPVISWVIPPGGRHPNERKIIRNSPPLKRSSSMPMVSRTNAKPKPVMKRRTPSPRPKKRVVWRNEITPKKLSNVKLINAVGRKSVVTKTKGPRAATVSERKAYDKMKARVAMLNKKIIGYEDEKRETLRIQAGKKPSKTMFMVRYPNPRSVKYLDNQIMDTHARRKQLLEHIAAQKDRIQKQR